jgi:hypothetical protein
MEGHLIAPGFETVMSSRAGGHGRCSLRKWTEFGERKYDLTAKTVAEAVVFQFVQPRPPQRQRLAGHAARLKKVGKAGTLPHVQGVTPLEQRNAKFICEGGLTG